MTVLCLLVVGALGLYHGRSMYELGRERGRLDARLEELERPANTGRHLKIVR